MLLLVAALLLGGAGTLWWAAIHRHVAGTAVAGDVLEPGESPSRWTPVPVEPCSRAELGRERDGADGTERCQRSPGPEGGQHWVRQPPGGFPKSDPAGHFPGEACTADGDTGYTPTGDRVACTRGKWQIVT